MKSTWENLFIWDTVECIQDELELTDDRISSFIGISEESFLKRKLQKCDLKLTEVDKLSVELGLSFSAIANRDFDRRSLRNHFHGINKNYVPAKYRHGAYSRLFTLQNIVRQASALGLEGELLKHLQIRPSVVYGTENMNISALAIRDAFDFLSSYLCVEDYLAIGRKNAFQLKECVFGQRLSQANSFKELFEVFIEVVHFLEENWVYKIKSLSDEKVVLESHISEKMKEAFKGQHFSSREVSKFRLGFVVHLAEYIGLPVFQARTNMCTWSGADHCEFEILNTENKKRKFKSRHPRTQTTLN